MHIEVVGGVLRQQLAQRKHLPWDGEHRPLRRGAALVDRPPTLQCNENKGFLVRSANTSPGTGSTGRSAMVPLW